MLTNVDNYSILYLEMTEILLLYLPYEELTHLASIGKREFVSVVPSL